MNKIFENDKIKVSETGRDYDFIAVIENKTDKEIKIVFDDDEMEIYNFLIEPNDWVGFLADDEGYEQFEEVKNGRFKITQ